MKLADLYMLLFSVHETCVQYLISIMPLWVIEIKHSSAPSAPYLRAVPPENLIVKFNRSRVPQQCGIECQDDIQEVQEATKEMEG